MPPRIKYSREQIINAAINIAEKNGAESISARNIAKELGTSTKPIFCLFEDMDEVQREVIDKALEIYSSFINDEISSSQMPPLKASGFAYIKFAKIRTNLFKMIFLRDRNIAGYGNDASTAEPIIDMIVSATHLDREKARMFHLELWSFVHGIATMIATSYLDIDDDTISMMLTDEYMGLRYRYLGDTDNGSN